MKESPAQNSVAPSSSNHAVRIGSRKLHSHTSSKIVIRAKKDPLLKINFEYDTLKCFVFAKYSYGLIP